MNLRTRFLLIAAMAVVLASLASWLVFQRIVEGVIEQWGLRLAEVQVRYDSVRLLKPLEREVALARQMANSNLLKRWAVNPDDKEMEALALAEMESFRASFSDGGYFVALLESGAYYHNNATGSYDGRQLRYYLKPTNPDDAWFYTLVEQGRNFHLNVNPDTHLGVTKLWVDMLLRDGDRVLGVVGTGMELKNFLEDVVDLSQPGITTLFVDHGGAIQLHRDPDIIDYASIIKPEGQKNTLQGRLEREQDRQRVETMMAQLRDSASPEGRVISDFVILEGRRYLAGIVYMPTIDWYEVTLLDLAVLMPIDGFTPVAVAFTLSLLVALLAMHLALRRYVLRPVQALERAMIEMSDGNPASLRLPNERDEMGRLASHFSAMSTAIQNHTSDLEDKVRERTEALYRLASIDALTGLLNRRGMTDMLTREVARAERGGGQFGVLLCDIDHFKRLNDSRGHVAGDNALCEVARLLGNSMRDNDEAARWGGDEFLVLLAPCDDGSLTVIAERIRTLIEKQLDLLDIPLTVSIGAFLAGRGDTVETILQQVDEALYAAKNGGRNRLRIAASAASSPDQGDPGFSHPP